MEVRGEGAVSTGPLVPVMQGRSEAEARAAASLLEAHHIPALLDTDLPGVVIPFLPDALRRSGAPSVLVPLSLARSARRLLARADERRVVEVVRALAPELRRRVAARAVPVLARPPLDAGLSVPSPPELPEPALELPVPRPHDLGELDDADEVDDDERFVEPAPSPVGARLALAMAAVAAGLLGQHLLGRALGGEVAVRGLLGARAPLDDEPWRLVTAAFLHGSPSHVVGNAMFGLLAGVVLFGTHLVGATALTWLVASVVGLAAEAAFSPGAMVIGASAGNYGLVGLWTRGQVERSRVATFPRRERLRTLGIILLLVPGALTPFSSTGTRVAVMAHAVGFVTGYLCGHVFPRRLLPASLPAGRLRSTVAGWVALLGTAVALGASAARLAR